MLTIILCVVSCKDNNEYYKYIPVSEEVKQPDSQPDKYVDSLIMNLQPYKADYNVELTPNGDYMIVRNGDRIIGISPTNKDCSVARIILTDNNVMKMYR
jgi:hypothetical protein